MKKLSHSPIFSEYYELNVLYFSKACALNYFYLDDFYTVTFVTFLLSLYANYLINCIFKHNQVCDGDDIKCSYFYKKGRQNEVNIRNCAL